MTVELITAATPEIHEAMGRLIPQLSRSAAPMSEADVQRFLSQDSVHLFAFRPDEADAQGNRPILGMLSWWPSRSPPACARGWRTSSSTRPPAVRVLVSPSWRQPSSTRRRSALAPSI